MMKPFKRAIPFILSFILALIFIFPDTTYAAEKRDNPPREELEKKIEEVARKRGIPSVILKSIARVESIYQQYKPDGSVFRGSSGEIGLMQIYNRSGAYDSNRLKYDIDYNIEVSADILLNKWHSYGSVGNMDPNVLENWYFAIWAYNGWASVNNPNTGKKKYAYQESVYMVAEKEYGQKITPIDTNLLPQTGRPSKNIHIPTPQSVHYGDIEIYVIGDLVKVESNRDLTVRNSPGGDEIGKCSKGSILEVMEGPILKDRYYWYKVKYNNGNLEGWIVGNWVAKIGTIYPFDDIATSWAKDYIIELHELGIVNGSSDGYYHPDKYLTKEEMSVLIAKALSLDSEDYEITYKDSKLISDWAVEYVKAVSKAGIMTGNNEFHIFNPKDKLTREEIAVIIKKVFEYLKEEKNQQDNLDNEENQQQSNSISQDLDYSDASEISSWALDSVKFAEEKGIVQGSNGMYKPKDYLTKAQASKVIIRIIEEINEESTN